MKTVTLAVNSGGMSVGTADVEVFESVEEAIAFFDTEDDVLKLINDQHKANVLNKARTSATKNAVKNAMAEAKAKVKAMEELVAKMVAERQAEKAKLGE